MIPSFAQIILNTFSNELLTAKCIEALNLSEIINYMNFHANANIKTSFRWAESFGNGAGNNVIRYPGIVLILI